MAAVSDPRRYILSTRMPDDPIFEFEDSGKTDAKLLSPFIKEDSVVLDFGIGSGRVEPYLPKCKKLIGVDVSPRMLGLAKERLKSQQEVSLVQIRSNFIMPANKFDFAFSLGVLHHIPRNEARRIVHQIVKSLKPGGSFYLTMCSVPPESWSQSYTIDEAIRLLPPEGILDSIHGDRDFTMTGHKSSIEGGVPNQE